MAPTVAEQLGLEQPFRQIPFQQASYAGKTRMTLRNRGKPSGFSRLAAPMLERALRRATTKDSARLKAIVEGGELDA